MIKGAQAYFATQVTTTSQSDVLLMLYDGAIKFLNQSKVKIEEKNYAEKGILISKAMDIIGELDSSLNPEKGGEVAQNLHQLYFYCNARLLRANMDMNTELVDEVVRILSSLREAFETIKGDAPEVAAPTGAVPQARPMAAAPKQLGSPMVSAARVSRAYGAGQPNPAQNGEAPEQAPSAPTAPVAPQVAQQSPAPEPVVPQTATLPKQSPETSTPQSATPSGEPQKKAPTLVRPAPSPTGPTLVAPAKKPTPLRKPGLPGAYGRQGPKS
ncbi:flagellar export chaperone FliS [Desulfovibrio ferrophilus]|uniref:Flagellar protein FliS n=1 Tax=Desulfovibrio ferrophilus TaxID=241368 RepID=A0A2Z6AZJ3_9BACT|nr:flagellar export chaperone FliS [Desulfovibrio ferrophilus]BBD08638.1 flagellar protein FliS [Desulfovibrio ferrophilus]